MGEHFDSAETAFPPSPPQGPPASVDLAAQPVPPGEVHTGQITFAADPGAPVEGQAGPLTLTADAAARTWPGGADAGARTLTADAETPTGPVVWHRGRSGARTLTADAETPTWPGGVAPGAAAGVPSPTDPRPWGVPNPGPEFAAPGPLAEMPPGAWVDESRTTGPTSFADLFRVPQPPRAPHRWGLGAYLLVEVTFLLLSVLLSYLLAGRLTSSAGAIALALAVPTVGAAGLALLITRIRGNGPRIDLGLRVTRRDVVIGLLCGLAGLVITIPASLLYVAIVGTDASSAVGDAFGGVRAGPVLAILVFVIVVFVAPLCEEIVYRGLLWGAVERLGANRWWTLVVTTVVFALAHFEFSRTPLLLVVAIPIGVARVITGRLSAGVIAHQINNLLPGVVLMLSVLGAVPMT